jgi:hypothetical protein
MAGFSPLGCPSACIPQGSEREMDPDLYALFV